MNERADSLPIDVFSASDLRQQLRRTENPLVERKSEGDFKDLRRTAVGFANSLPVGVPSVIFFPAKNDGTPESHSNLDSLQTKVANELARAYPPLPFTFRVFEADGIALLAIIVFGSEMRPHFADRSYVREASRTVEASGPQFERLIAERNSKAYEILKWLDKSVTLSIMSLPDSRSHAIYAQGHFMIRLRSPRAINSG